MVLSASCFAKRVLEAEGKLGGEQAGSLCDGIAFFAALCAGAVRCEAVKLTAARGAHPFAAGRGRLGAGGVVWVRFRERYDACLGLWFSFPD